MERGVLPDGTGVRWWGRPWPSLVCYTEDGHLRADTVTPVPVGDSCHYCEEPIQQGDGGVTMPHLDPAGVAMLHTHRECALRDVIGPLPHLLHYCTCAGGALPHVLPEQTARQAALAVWEWIHRPPTNFLPRFTCPRCGFTSPMWEDAREGYCGRCCWYTGHPQLGQEAPPPSPG